MLNLRILQVYNDFDIIGMLLEMKDSKYIYIHIIK